MAWNTTFTTTRPPASSATVWSAGRKNLGWETLLNRAGLTFKKLPDKDKQGLTERKATALMLDKPSMIKRPVLDLGGGKLLVGFKPETYAEAVTARD
jgi:arsenate reductase (glutaredoxin)